MTTEKKPVFQGNAEDLAQFEKLVASPIRSDEREAAIHAWQTYKLSRQSAVVQGNPMPNLEASAGGVGKQGIWTKGDYIRSLTTRAIDLRGATLTDVCLGYVDLRGVLLDDAVFGYDYLAWTALKGARLENASLKNVQLPGARLMEADFRGADLNKINLADADLTDANMKGVNLSGADLSRADLFHTDLSGAILSGAILTEANLKYANLVDANIEGAVLDRSQVYGVAAWDLRGKPASSQELVVTPDGASLTVDQIQVAQFIYLLMNNPEIRDVLDTVTRKVVLLLGRFKRERKAVLDALRIELRKHDFVPILFDFDKPSDRDVTETVTLLARMARFIVADLTEPSSIPQELQAIAPDIAVPIRLIIQEGFKPYSMSKDLRKYHWVIKPHRYKDKDELLATLQERIIDVAEAKRQDIIEERADDGW